MRIGTSLLLIAVGAILRFAVEANADGFNIQTAGLILIVVGAVGLVLSLFFLSQARRDTVVERPVVRERDRY
jgi:membrane-bound ClpP family serine protease